MATCYRHNFVLFPISFLLLSGGIAFLVVSGLARVKLYSATRHFRSADCYVIVVNETGSRPCGGVDSPTSFPCVTITVRYKFVADNGPAATGSGNEAAMLYETILQKPEIDGATNLTDFPPVQCSKTACSYSTTGDNAADVERYVRDVTVTSRRCYVDPSDASRAYTQIVTSTNAIHALLWPAMAIGFGFFVLLVAVCQSCDDARVCQRRRSTTIQRNPLPIGGGKAEIDSAVYGGSACDSALLRKSSSFSSAAAARASTGWAGRANSGGSGSGCSTCERATVTSTSMTSSSGSSRSLLPGSLSRMRSRTSEKSTSGRIAWGGGSRADRTSEKGTGGVGQPPFDCNTV